MVGLVTIGANGSKAAKKGKPPSKRGERGKIVGWSKNAARGNREFLWSIDVRPFMGEDSKVRAVSFTLTIRDCPERVEEWKRLIRNLRLHLTSFGVIAVHYCIEWHERGRAKTGPVPHLHGMVLTVQPHELQNYIVQTWMKVAGRYGTNRQAQDSKIVWNAERWMEYLGKHSGRGVSHYQRNPNLLPKMWTTTGRLWGRFGDWPTIEARRLLISDADYFALRRRIKKWEISKVRRQMEDAQLGKQKGLRKQLAFKRRMYKRNELAKSELVSLSTWIPQDVMQRFVSVYEVLPEIEKVKKHVAKKTVSDSGVQVETAKFVFAISKPCGVSSEQ